MRNKLNVKLLRKFLNKTQEEIAFDFGLTGGAWSNYERTNSFPPDLIRKLHNKFKKEINELNDLNADFSQDLTNDEASEGLSKCMSRVTELEELIKQKDNIITNQLSLLELQNRTIEALKGSFRKS